MAKPNFPVRDVMARTLQNLQLIEEQERAGIDSAWEVTQLINSFAGIVLHPWESWEKQLRDIDLDSEAGKKWPELEPDHPDIDEKVSTVGDLVRLVRNAFAHGNIIFLESDEDREEISGFQIWNANKENFRTWSSTVDIATLRLLLIAMMETSKGFPHDPKQRSMPIHQEDATVRYAPKIKNPLCPTCGRTVKPGNRAWSTLTGQTS